MCVRSLKRKEGIFHVATQRGHQATGAFKHYYTSALCCKQVGGSLLRSPPSPVGMNAFLFRLWWWFRSCGWDFLHAVVFFFRIDVFSDLCLCFPISRCDWHVRASLPYVTRSQIVFRDDVLHRPNPPLLDISQWLYDYIMVMCNSLL